MSTELYLIHIGFILALVWSVYRSGRRTGREDMVNQLIEDKLVLPKDIITFYKTNKEDL